LTGEHFGSNATVLEGEYSSPPKSVPALSDLADGAGTPLPPGFFPPHVKYRLVSRHLGTDRWGYHAHGRFITKACGGGIRRIGKIEADDPDPSGSPSGALSRLIRFQDLHPLAVAQPRLLPGNYVPAVNRHHYPDFPVKQIAHRDAV